MSYHCIQVQYNTLLALMIFGSELLQVDPRASYQKDRERTGLDTNS